jgi:hypothetical protein
MPVGLEFASPKADMGFSVAPLPFSVHDDPPVKVIFSVPPPPQFSGSVDSQFNPQPIFDSIWKTPKIPSSRKLEPPPLEHVPVMTRKMLLAAAETPAEKKRIARLYPFLKAKELKVFDGDDEEEVDAVHSYSRGERPVSHRTQRNGAAGRRNEEPPKEIHSLPSVRRGRNPTQGRDKDG